MAGTLALQSKRIGLRNSSFRFLLVFALLATLSACAKVDAVFINELDGWERAHLYWLGSGETDNPRGHLIAAYYRQTGLESQIRLDFLEMPDFYQPEILLAVDTLPGGSSSQPGGAPSLVEWEFLFSIKPGLSPVTYLADGTTTGTIIPRLVRDSRLDAIVISWNDHVRSSPSAALRFQASILESGKIISQTPSIRSGLFTFEPAPLLLAFWNTLPAASPAQTLRRWDGAHTGPLGQRHGLNVLLSLSSQYRVPLALLDLSHPESLQALEYMQKSQSLQPRALKGDLLVPIYAWGESASTQMSLAISTQASQSLGWPQSQVAFGAFQPSLPAQFSHFFADLPERHHLINYQGKVLIPLPRSIFKADSQSEDSITPSGLSLSAKKALLQIALSSDPADLVVFGGNLTQSLWAEHSVAPAVFDYIARHPWISILSTPDLLAFPAVSTQTWPLSECADLLCSSFPSNDILNTSQGSDVPSGFSFARLSTTLRSDLSLLPENVYAKLANNSFLSLTSPNTDPDLSNLRAGYLGHVSYLIFASNWSAQPSPLSTCALDLDWDGMPECILASDRTLLIFELDGGRLVFAGSPTTPWITPSSLFSVGAGDKSTWQLGLGSAADPLIIPGAAALSTHPFNPYLVELKSNRLIFSLPGSSEQKSFTLLDDNLLIEISSPQGFTTQIPFLLQSVSSPPALWSESANPSCKQTQCELQYASGPVHLTIQNAQIGSQVFTDSAEFMRSAEIPDHSYPPGHFLPFHFAVINLTSVEQSLPVTILINFW